MSHFPDIAYGPGLRKTNFKWTIYVHYCAVFQTALPFRGRETSTVCPSWRTKRIKSGFSWELFPTELPLASTPFLRIRVGEGQNGGTILIITFWSAIVPQRRPIFSVEQGQKKGAGAKEAGNRPQGLIQWGGQRGHGPPSSGKVPPESGQKCPHLHQSAPWNRAKCPTFVTKVP